MVFAYSCSFFYNKVMNATDFTSIFKEALLSTPKTSSLMQPEDFLGHLFTTDEQIASKTASDFYSGGNLTVRNSWSFDIQELPCFLLLYTTAGCGKLLINQHVISLTERSLLLLNCRQRFRIDVAVSPWKYQVLFFDSTHAAELLDLITGEAFCILNTTAHSEYVLHLEKLLYLNSEKTTISQLRASDLLNHLLTEYTVEFLKKDQNYHKIPSYIEKIHDLFEEHYEENYSLNDLEIRFNISKYRICREFGEHYGITPLQYLNQRRIRIACHLLETTSLRIHETGSAVGIENTNHFISLFKKYKGCTPLEYKNREQMS